MLHKFRRPLLLDHTSTRECRSMPWQDFSHELFCPWSTYVHTTNTPQRPTETKASKARPRHPPSLSSASLSLRGRFRCRRRVSAHPQRRELPRHVLDQVGGGDRREGPPPRCGRESRPCGAAPAHSFLVGKPGEVGVELVGLGFGVGLGWVRAPTAVIWVKKKKGKGCESRISCGLSY